MPPLKNQRHELFAQGLASGMSGTEAYESAGYTPNSKNVARLKVNEEIIARVLELQGKMTDRLILTKQYVIEATIENAEKALGRRPVRVGSGEDAKDVYLYRGEVANQALKMLGAEFGLFTERKDVRISNEFSKLSDAELAQRLVDAGQKLLLEATVIEHEPAEQTGEEAEDGDDGE